MRSKDDIRKAFENGDKPKQEDFWEWQDSYWHKEDPQDIIPANRVDLSAKADLINGKVPAEQLPGFVDDILEFETLETFPAEGEAGKLFLAKNTNKLYRWSGSQYVDVTPAGTNPGANVNISTADLTSTEARTFTQNASFNWNTLGNPHIVSGLPNKNSDITNFRKVRVQNTSGLDAVVDSKNTLTDGVTSMTDAEKDAWRLAQRKTGETYSTGQPRIDYILPFRVSKEIKGIQYISVIGLNLFLNLSDCDIKLINTSTNVQYPVNVIQTSASNNSQFSFGYDISTLPNGLYKISVRNQLLTNVDNTTFEVVDKIVSKNITNLQWQQWKIGGTFNTSYASGGTIFRQAPSTSGEVVGSHTKRAIEFLSDEILSVVEANDKWAIRTKVTIKGPTGYSGLTSIGIVESSKLSTPLGTSTIDYGIGTVGNGGGSWAPVLFPNMIQFANLNNITSKEIEFLILKNGSIISFFAVWNNTYYYSGSKSLISNLSALRLLYTDNTSTNYSYGNAEHTIVIQEVSV